MSTSRPRFLLRRYGTGAMWNLRLWRLTVAWGRGGWAWWWDGKEKG